MSIDPSEDEQAEHDLASSNIVEVFLKFLFLWQYAFRVSDVGLSLLLSFISKFLVVVAHVLSLKHLGDFATKLPKTVAGARAVLGKNTDNFDKYACCPSCSAIYSIDQCKVRTTGDGFE